MFLRLHFPNAADGESLLPSEWSVRSTKPTPFLFLGTYIQKTLILWIKNMNVLYYGKKYSRR